MFQRVAFLCANADQFTQFVIAMNIEHCIYTPTPCE